jgi:hypothetical protein
MPSHLCQLYTVWNAKPLPAQQKERPREKMGMATWGHELWQRIVDGGTKSNDMKKG